MHRREFIKQIAGGTLAASFGWAAPVSGRRYRAAVIGATGQGNYGHGLDTLLTDLPGVEVVAVADPDSAGRARAQARCRAARSYAQYEELLEKERPDLVAVAPRWSTLHYARVRAALEHGAHVICEKPFTETLAQADELLALAERQRLKIAVAHQARLAPGLVRLKQELDRGMIGELLQIRMQGKNDQRAGGEDLLVLGLHEFHLVRYLAGEPLWCTARILQGGREVTRRDIRAASEGDGRIIGDEIEAMVAYPRGLNVYFNSRARLREVETPYTMELIGQRGVVRFGVGFNPQPLVRGPLPGGAWQPLAGVPPSGGHEQDERDGNRRLGEDWLAAIASDREPACSGRSAMQALEMVHGIFAAGLSQGRVAFPLVRRAHPLAEYS